MKTIKFFLLLVLTWLCLGAYAKPKEVYSSFDKSTGTLTYYYDDQRSSRPKTEIYDPYNTRFKDYAEDVRKGKIDISMKDAPLTSTEYMFYGNYYFSCSTSGFTETWTSHTIELYNMTEIEGLENLNTGEVTDMSCMFLGCSALRTIDFGKVDTRNVTDMRSMFSGCYNLTSLNITSFNTAKVTNMSSMFYGCSSLPSIDLRSFDIAKVTNMSSMFYRCTRLKTILCDDDWSGSEVLKDANGMFEQCASLAGGCGTACDGENKTGPDYARPDEGDKRPGYFTKQEIYTVFNDKTKTLTYYCDGARQSRPGIAEVYDPVGEPDAKRFKEYHQLVKKAKIDPSMKNARLTSMANMFYGNEEATGNTTVRYSLSEMTEISGMEYLNTEDVQSMEYMFNYCSSLTSVNLLSFNTAKLKYANRMFFGCTKLATVFCNGDWSASDVLEYSGGMFGGCVSLRGEKGTVCDGEANIDKTCAVQDGLDGNKGYFTSVNEVYTSFDAQTGTLTYYCDKRRPARTAAGKITEIYAPEKYKTDSVRFKNYHDKVLRARIDVTMKDTMLTSMYKMFGGWGEKIHDFRTDCYYLSKMTEISDLENLNTSKVVDMSKMFFGCLSLTSLDLSAFKTANVTNMAGMFEDCWALTSIDLSSFNTANVKNMSYMFYWCDALTSIDLSSFNTANVTDMGYMFSFCFALTTLDLSSFNTSNVTNMSYMFRSCVDLTTLNLSSFNTANVTNMNGMFAYCESLTSLDIRNFNIANAKTYKAFSDNEELKTIYCNNDWSKSSASVEMFDNCPKLKGGNGTKYNEDNITVAYACPDGIGGRKGYFTAVTQAYTVFDEATGTLTYYYDDQQAVHDGTIEAYTPGTGRDIVRFTGYADKVKKVVIDASFKNATMTTLSHMFDGGSEETHLSALETIEGMENINYAPVTSTYEMFNGCASLKTIDLDWFSPANLTIMEGMFAGCSSLETLDLVHFNTSGVTSMYRLFEGCSSLKSVNLNSFDTSEVGNMIAMFKGCSSLEKLDLRLFDTGNVTVMMSMFDGCSSLKSLDLKTFNISNVTDMAWMFNGCSSLESIDLRSFNTVSATSMSYMFKDCRKLAFLDLGSFNTTNVKDMIRMFAGCTSLKTVYANSDWGKSTILVNSEGMFEGCTSLVGGNGTECDGTNNTGKTYARIDNGESAQGYFTVNNEVYTAYDAETGTLTYYYDNLRLFRTDQTELYDPKDNTTVRFKDYCDKVLVVEIDESMKNAELRSMHNLFFGGGEYDEKSNYVRYPLTNAAEIDGMEYLNTEKVTDMNGMFYGCASIDSLDLASFNTDNVTDMKWMFSGCTKLATIRCKFHWDESGKLEQSEKMFEGCTSLVGEKGTKCDGVNNIDKTYARPDNGEKAPGYFTTIKEQYTVFNEETATLTYYYDDKCLEREGIVEMYTPTKGDAIRFEGYAEKIKKAVIHKSYRHLIKKSLACMFYGGTSSTCLAEMESVEGLENLRTEKVTDVHDMFLGCRSLKEVDVTPLITSKVKNFRRMFFECASLKELNVDGFDIRKATNMTNMFANCTSLTTIWNENSWKVSGVTSYDMFYNCPALVGGHGSEYDESHCNNEYALPDGGRKKPGYFTMTPHLERRFTVSENGDQIRFSLGNLQYNPTNNKWRFAPNQWNNMLQSNQYIWSITYSGWLDLFGWGTGNDPLSANTNGSEYASYTEWGKNKIGSDDRNTWRAPTTAEWDYIFNKRADASSKYGAAKVNDVGGLVILPDLWELPADCKFTPGMVTGGYDWYYATNVYSTTQWEKMEKAGAIFLPAGGYRYYNGNKHVYTDNVGYYWTSTPTNDIYYRAYNLYFTAYSLDAEKTFGRYFGCSVRLVKDIRDIPDFTLTLTTEGSGTVTGAGRYMQDEEATLSAKAGDGWEFVKWSDENTDNPRQITMTADLILTAVFEEIPVPDFTLTLTTAGEGTVTGAGTYKQGEVVTITATPDEGYGFSQWSDGSTDAWRQITIRSNMTLTAVFQIRSYDLTVNVEGEGTVTGAGTYTHNEVITLEATAGEGYEFSQWSDGNTDNPRLITITGNTDITAVFTPVQPEELEPLPGNETTVFDFSLIGPDGSKMLGVTLDAKDNYNKEEGRIEVASTNTAAEVDAKLDKAFSGTATLKPFLPGTITFELPAGEGTIEIDCQTMPGYTLNIRIAEYGTAYITSTIEQALRGKATVNYSVTQNTYVVIYLEGAPAGSAPARIARSAAEENAGAYIWSITVIPNKTPTGIDTTDIHQSANAKFIKDGILYIRHNGRVYTAQGAEAK